MEGRAGAPAVVGLTPKQASVLRLIQAWTDLKGHAPSIRELQSVIGLKSTSGVHRYLACLVERGYLRTLPNRARAYEVIARIADNPIINKATAAETVARKAGVA